MKNVLIFAVLVLIIVAIIGAMIYLLPTNPVGDSVEFELIASKTGFFTEGVTTESIEGTEASFDFLKAISIGTDHLTSNWTTLAGETWIGSGGKIGYMGNNNRYSWAGVVAQAYINENGSLVLQTLGGETIIFGGNPNDS